ncbi:ABC transporter permease [Angelakisella massiliensis]|uniref:ABC transporter permease n=1 Tax=Angelakisella massiliensis TaxID=1871018 RepID=UPI0008F814A1|nr:ABC transporter permease [Angelakisella massiliensis]
MRLGEIFRLVWINILGNKFKMMLTSLGIIVGAATIVMVIAIGRGGQMDVEDQFKNLSAGAIDISYNNSSSGSSGGGMMPMMPGGGARGVARGGGAARGGMMPSFGVNRNITLSKDDVEELELFVPDITAVSISATAKKGVTGGDLEEETQYTIAGVTESYQEVSNLTMAIGEFITEENDTNQDKVCVLGSSIAEEIFGSAMEAFDSIIYIDGRSYTVYGVLERMGTVSSGISPDEAIFVPYDTAEKYIMGRDISPQITVVAEDVNEVPEVIENIKIVLDQNYTNANFTITDAGSKMEAATSSADTLAMLLVAVASIVFIVGGIGIMNVLFVSVQERTREIGILKALGASKRDILLEFLAEAFLISAFGGVVGIGLSMALMPLMSYTGMRVEPSLTGYVLALLFAVVTGTVFGFYPARKAAALVPIEALNME